MNRLGFEPMELRAVADIPAGDEWLYEPKWDGFRALAHRDGADAALISKHGQPLARYFPEVAAALARLTTDGFSLDGELVVPLAGALSFDALQQRIHPAASRVALLAQTTPAHYLIFDLLRDDGVDLRALPLGERRARLERFAAHFGTVGSAHVSPAAFGGGQGGALGDVLRLSPATTSRAVVDDWFARVGGALDGVVAKRLDLPYLGGLRDGGVKIKHVRTADCVIGGFRYASGASDRVGSLLLGLYDEGGLLDYIGFCSAFATPERLALIERLAPYRDGVGAGFSGSAPDEGPSRWNRGRERDRSFVALRPALVLEVAFDAVTGGRIRHGTKPLRWRTDKPAARCTIDQLRLAGSALGLLDLQRR
jgi:ATP-dependent DNA ligase